MAGDMLVLRSSEFVSSPAVVPDSWDVQRPRRRLQSPYNIMMPRNLALASVSCVLEVLSTAVQSVLSIVLYSVLAVCGPHEGSSVASLDPG